MKYFSILFFLVIMGLFPLLHAADQSTKKPVLNKINDLPSINQVQKQPDIQIGEYDGAGTIEDFHGESLVLGDSLYKLSSPLEIYDIKGNRTSRKLTKGLYVYYFLDQQKKQIKKIYIAK